jgi:hypothetical protein
MFPTPEAFEAVLSKFPDDEPDENISPRPSLFPFFLMADHAQQNAHPKPYPETHGKLLSEYRRIHAS